VRPACLGGDRAGVDPRHLQYILKQPRQALHFGQDQLALLGLIRG
jgi:hypothetical protein